MLFKYWFSSYSFDNSSPNHISCNCTTQFKSRGGSRIPRRRGRQPSGGAPTYEIAKFSKKLHEIEKISGRVGGRGAL